MDHRLTHLRVKHLRLLQLLVQHGTLRSAARQLHVTQPAASQMLRDLEEVFGINLFERGRRGMSPTAASQALVSRARVILRELQAMEGDVAAVSEGGQATISMGVLPRCIYSPVPQALARLYTHELQPHVHVSVASSSQLLAALEQGKLDIVLARLVDDYSRLLNAKTYDILPLFDERTVVVSAKNHPLARRKKVRLQDLVTCDWVLPAKSAYTRRLIDAEFVNHGLNPPVPKVEAPTAIALGLMQRSAFLSICPASIANDAELNKAIHILPLKVKVPLPPICAIWRSSKRDDSAIIAVKEALLAATQSDARPV